MGHEDPGRGVVDKGHLPATARTPISMYKINLSRIKCLPYCSLSINRNDYIRVKGQLSLTQSFILYIKSPRGAFFVGVDRSVAFSLRRGACFKGDMSKPLRSQGSH